MELTLSNWCWGLGAGAVGLVTDAGAGGLERLAGAGAVVAGRLAEHRCACR